MATNWYVMIVGNEFGPMNADELRQMAQSKQLSADDKVRKGEDGRWVDAFEIQGLFDSGTVAVQTARASKRPASETTEQAAPQHKTCQFCGEQILAVAKKCKHCGETLDRSMRARQQARHVADREVSRTPEWSPGVAALLSFVIPGAGQIYKGQVLLGILWFFGAGFFYLLMLAAGPIGIVGLAIHLWSVFHAASSEA